MKKYRFTKSDRYLAGVFLIISLAFSLFFYFNLSADAREMRRWRDGKPPTDGDLVISFKFNFPNRKYIDFKVEEMTNEELVILITYLKIAEYLTCIDDEERLYHCAEKEEAFLIDLGRSLLPKYFNGKEQDEKN